jgi:hypothetical protein
LISPRSSTTTVSLSLISGHTRTITRSPIASLGGEATALCATLCAPAPTGPTMAATTAVRADNMTLRPTAVSIIIVL